MFSFIKPVQNLLLSGLILLTNLQIYFIIIRTQEFFQLKKRIVEQAKTKALLIEKADNLKVLFLELSQNKTVLIEPSQSSDTFTLLLTVLFVFGILFSFYYTATAPIFCPIRTMSQFDKLGNEILIGIRYPVESPVSAGIRIMGTPDVVPLTNFVKTVAQNDILKESTINSVSPVVLQNGPPLFETFKMFLSDLIHFFF